METLTALNNYDASRLLCNYCTEASDMQTILGYVLCLTCFICLCWQSSWGQETIASPCAFKTLVALSAVYSYLLTAVATGLVQCLFRFPEFLLIGCRVRTPSARCSMDYSFFCSVPRGRNMKPAPTETIYKRTWLWLLCHVITGMGAVCPFLHPPGWQQGKITPLLQRGLSHPAVFGTFWGNEQCKSYEYILWHSWSGEGLN